VSETEQRGRHVEAEAAGVTLATRPVRGGRVRRVLTWALVAVLVALVATAGVAAAQRINQPLSATTLHAGLASSSEVVGGPPALPWPSTGEAAVAVPTIGYSSQSGYEEPVPIASLTKLTTAVVVLHDHPIAPGTDGPPITVTAADAAEYGAELHQDESTVAIQAGEVLTERQMLEALLVVSANDIAYSLALWDAGTESVFVGKMNALAEWLGATSSHFVDASGFDPDSRSTAADCLRIAADGMRDPTFAAVVAMSTVTLPLIGTVHNVVHEVGSDGVVGIKSGYTSQAGGCYVLAGVRTIEGRPMTVLVAVLGQQVPPPVPISTTTSTSTTAPPPPQPGTTTTLPPGEFTVPDPFRYTSPIADALLSATESGLVQVTVSNVDAAIGSATTSWGGRTYRVPVVTAHRAWLFAWPGQRVASAAELRPVAPGSQKGSTVGSAMFALGSQIQVVPLELATTIPEPSLWWRLVHRV
jgi:serine-type D-Ala-D-Ala carboxypeptidase (penicillin-binding protein 5/6)